MASRSRPNIDSRLTSMDPRQRAFWLAAAAVLVSLALLITLGGGDEPETPVTEDSATLPAPPPPATPDALVAPEEAPPQAQSAAEGFAADYVRYAYGLAAATEITDASPELVALLESNAPRVTAIQAQLADTAEATGVNLSMDSETAANGVMTVSDKDSLYKLKFKLREDRGQWLVTDVSATG